MPKNDSRDQQKYLGSTGIRTRDPSHKDVAQQKEQDVQRFIHSATTPHMYATFR